MNDQYPRFLPGRRDPTGATGIGWKEELLDLLRRDWAPHEVFTLGDVYQYVEPLSSRHPENHRVEEKIRQVLQDLRDDGELVFEDGRGRYSLGRPSPLPNDPVLRETGPHSREKLLLIRDLLGQIVSSQELRRQIPGFGGQRGIFKPRDSRHPLWIRETSRGKYPDREPISYPDGSWSYRYSPEGRDGRPDLDLDANRAMLRAIEDRVPIGVFRQRESVAGRTAYEVLGLATVESFDGTHFHLRGEPIDASRPPFETIETTFHAFQSDPARVSRSFRIQRDRRFGVALRRVYDNRCSLCGVGYRVSGRLVGVDAAHIVPVEENGVMDDVRNGMLLCKNHHALFDQFAWTFDREFRVLVAPDEGFRRSAAENHLLRWEERPLQNLPKARADFPGLEAIDWRLDRFEKTWK